MNYFKTIKAALDASFAGICCHRKLNPEQAMEAIKVQLTNMSKEWRSGETPNIQYSDPLCRFAYLYCHTAANANLCELAIRESPGLSELLQGRLEREGELMLCAFGGGPGTELLAMSKHLLKVRPANSGGHIKLTLLEEVPEWSETLVALEAEIRAGLKERYGAVKNHPFSISWNIVPYDMTEGGNYANLPHLFQQDFFVMNYVLSEVIGDHTKFQEVIRTAATSCPTGSKFLVIDRDEDRVIQNATTMLQQAGLTLSGIQKTCRPMDDEEKSDALEEYKSKIGRQPRVRWGSRETGRGAFFIMGTKGHDHLGKLQDRHSDVLRGVVHKPPSSRLLQGRQPLQRANLKGRP
jgi:hypothetical protein